MTEEIRQNVVRADGREVEIIQRRGHLSYCFFGCCCGRTDKGFAAAPVNTYKEEWLRRKMRRAIHLTKAGCLGPCTLANVASLVFDSRAVWFHSIDSPELVKEIFLYIDAMMAADHFLEPSGVLLAYVFNYYDWDVRSASVPILIESAT